MQGHRSFSFRTESSKKLLQTQSRTNEPQTNVAIQKQSLTQAPTQTRAPMQTQVAQPKVHVAAQSPVAQSKAQVAAQPPVAQPKMQIGARPPKQPAQPASSLQSQKAIPVPQFQGETRFPGMTQTLESILNEPITEDEYSLPGLQIMGLVAKRDKGQPVQKKKPKLERVLPNEEATCIKISQLYNDESMPNKDERDLLKWPVPNSNGDIAFNLCFYVREVQHFIVDNEKITQEKTTDVPEIRECPMFQTEQIQSVFDQHKLAYVVPQIMDVDFRSVFLEYDTMPQKLKLGKDDITTIVMERVQAYIVNSLADPKVDEFALQTTDAKEETNPVLKAVGSFWYAARQSLRYLGKVSSYRGAKVALWMLSNPVCTRLIFMIAKIIRITICIYTTFSNISNLTVAGFMDRLIVVLPGNAKMIAILAKDALGCVTALMKAVTFDLNGAFFDAAQCAFALPKVVGSGIYYYAPQFLKNFLSTTGDFVGNTISLLIRILKVSLQFIISTVGLPIIFNIPSVMSREEDILGLGKHITTIENIRLAFTTWSPVGFGFNTVLLLFDLAVVVIDIMHLSNGDVDLFVRRIAARIPRVGPWLEKGIANLSAKSANVVDVHRVKLNALRYVLVQARRLAALTFMYNDICDAFYELYEWVFDLFPCLFKYVGNMLLWIMTLGYKKILVPGDFISGQPTQKLEPTCCMTSIIRELQRQYVFGEIGRGINVRRKEAEEKFWNVPLRTRAYNVFWGWRSGTPQEILDEQQNAHDDLRAFEASMEKQGGAIQSSYTNDDLFSKFQAWQMDRVAASRAAQPPEPPPALPSEPPTASLTAPPEGGSWWWDSTPTAPPTAASATSSWFNFFGSATQPTAAAPAGSFWSNFFGSATPPPAAAQSSWSNYFASTAPPATAKGSWYNYFASTAPPAAAGSWYNYFSSTAPPPAAKGWSLLGGSTPAPVKRTWFGSTETMTVTTNITGIPCVNDAYVQKTHITGMERDLPFHGGKLRFYLCVDDDGSVRWHLSRNDMMGQFPNDIVYGDVDKFKVVLPIDLFSTQEQMYLANVPIMLVRL